MGRNIEEQKLKETIKQYIDEYKENETFKISSITFTTFDFNTAFFEMQLLPYLFDVSSKKYLGKNREMAVAFDIDEKIENVKLSVYYSNIVDDGQKYINYESQKIVLKEGVFHPKLIIIKGRKQRSNFITVIVLSANLTTNSYGTNMEVLAVLEDKLNKRDEELAKALDEGKITEEKLYTILKGLNKKFPELIISGNFEGSKTIKEKLDNAKQLTVISPFISNEVLEEYKNTDTIILENFLSKERDTERIKANLENGKIKLMRHDGDRRIHEKIYLIKTNENDKQAIIGSHNFTKSAIEKNIEASIVINDNDIIQNLNQHYKQILKCSNEVDLDNAEIQYKNDEEEQFDRVDIISAIVDWDNSVIEIKLQNKSNTGYIYDKIELTQIGNTTMSKGFACKKDNVFIYGFNENTKENRQLQRLLYRNRYFRIKADKYEVEGLFNEINISKIVDRKRALNTDNYFDLIDYEFDNSYKLYLQDENEQKNNEQENKKSTANLENDSDWENNINKYNVIKLFKAYNKINREIDEEINNLKNKEGSIKQINQYLDSKFIKSPDSISQIIDIFLNEMNIEDLNNNNQILYFLLTCNELDLLEKKYNKLKETYNKENSFRKLKTKELKEAYKKIQKKAIEHLDSKDKEVLETFLKHLRKE